MKTLSHIQKLLTGLIYVVIMQTNYFQAQSLVTQTYSYTGTIQTFTVPACVSTMTIETRGAQGGGGGGNGARMIGTFTVSAGQVLKILVGQAGGVAPNQVGNGGGGGSFVTLLNNTPLCIAGGGGGTAHNTSNGGYALIGGTTAQPGQVGQFAGAGNGGSPGNGGFESYTTGGNIPNGGGGGGLLTNGGSAGAAMGGSAFVNGGAGGPTTGGFGGGGGSNLFIYGCGSSPHGGSGGGGYSGGGAGGSNCNGAGGGGGSFNSGTNQSNTSAFQTGNGLVVLTYGFNGNGVAASASPTAICSGSSATLSASGMNSYTWSTGSNSSSVVVSPGVTTSYTVSGTNSVGCVSSSVLNVTVNAAAPILTVVTSTTSLCLGKTATLTASGALTYSWTNGVSNGVSFSPSVTTTYTVFGQNGCGTTTAVTTITVAPLAIAAISSPTLLCAGSPATLTAVSPGTSYTWQPFNLPGSSIAVNPTVTTVYTVTASDGTCAGVTNVTIAVNPVPTISISAPLSTVCLGSSITLTANGAISYTWNPGNINGNLATVSPTVLTLFTVVGSNSFNCTSSASQVMFVNTGPAINVSASSSTICAGSQVTLTASGATSYTWSPGNGNNQVFADNPLATTIYTVTGTVQGNSCSTDKTISVQVFQPNISIVSSASAVCIGASITFTASGASSYQWSNGLSGAINPVSPTVTTIYTLTTVSGPAGLNCVSTNTVQANVYSNPSVTAVATKTAICKGETTTLTAGGASTYTWNNNSTNTVISVSPLVTTNYTVTGKDINGCTKAAILQLRVNTCSGFAELNLGNNISVYPNPSKGEFFIETNTETEVLIINQLGQIVRDIKLNSGNNYKINVSGLPVGIYLINGKLRENEFNKKVIIMN